MPDNVTITSGPLVLSGSMLQRPNNVTAYDPNDIVGDANRALFTLSEVSAAAFNTGFILKMRVSKTNPSPASFRLFLFNEIPTGSLKDNDPFKFSWNDHYRCIYYRDFDMISGGASSDAAFAMIDSIRVGFLCTNVANALYGVLVAKAAYTPLKNERFHVELLIEHGLVGVTIFDAPIPTTLPV